jgi:rhamnose utilization protein RhaD (predicted bifunctional aldolase and dehydrogenase)
VHQHLLKNPDIEAVFLKNHGVIVGAENLPRIDETLRLLIQCLCMQPPLMESAALDNPKIRFANLNQTSYRICPNQQLHALACNTELYQRLINSWAICPDHVVFLGADALCIDNNENLINTITSLNSMPPFVFVKDVGVLENCEATPAQRAQLTFYFDVMMRQMSGQKLETLSQEQTENILDWDAEKYRISINSKVAPTKQHWKNCKQFLRDPTG